MKLVHPDGSWFELSIVGYQFPELGDVDYDSNWLNIAIEVRHPRGTWAAVDPALLTYEVSSLAQWFRDLAAGARAERDRWFLEPCLSFHVPDDPERDEELVVEFSHEFRPPWASDDLDVAHVLAFPLQEIDLAAAANSLEQGLAMYPQRTDR